MLQIDFISFPLCYSQTKLLTFHSFSFFYFKTSNQGYLIPFHFIHFFSIPFLYLNTFYWIPFFYIPLWSFCSNPFHSLINSQTSLMFEENKLPKADTLQAEFLGNAISDWELSSHNLWIFLLLHTSCNSRALENKGRIKQWIRSNLSPVRITVVCNNEKVEACCYFLMQNYIEFQKL